MPYENLKIDTIDRILHITINRESKLNALNAAVLDELGEVFEATITDAEIRGIIITGSGSKAFVAGADISEFAHFTPEQGRQLAESGQKKVFDVIQNCPKPVLAAINGYALGGGLELALACHIRVASQNARLGLPEVSLGLIPGYGGTQRLVQLAGKGRALEMILTGEMITAAEALNFGIVNHVVEPSALMDKAQEIMYKISSRSSSAVSAAIKSVNAGFNFNIHGFEEEIEQFAACFGTSDFNEGVSAFLEKRAANFG